MQVKKMGLFWKTIIFKSLKILFYVRISSWTQKFFIFTKFDSMELNLRAEGWNPCSKALISFKICSSSRAHASSSVFVAMQEEKRTKNVSHSLLFFFLISQIFWLLTGSYQLKLFRILFTFLAVCLFIFILWMLHIGSFLNWLKRDPNIYFYCTLKYG